MRFRLGSLCAYGSGVRSFVFVLAALAPLGCAYSDGAAESVFDYQTPPYEGGSSSFDPTPSQTTIDASACKVQGAASLSGASFAAQDAIELFDTNEAKFTFLVTDYGSACSVGRGIRAGSSVLSIVYDGESLASGTYDLASTKGLSAKYVTYGSTCTATRSQTAQSGTVTFDRLDDCGGKGSFDFVIGGQHVTATFTASVCTASGPSSCQ